VRAVALPALGHHGDGSPRCGLVLARKLLTSDDTG
jgi:hypothetical protein